MSCLIHSSRSKRVWVGLRFHIETDYVPRINMLCQRGIVGENYRHHDDCCYCSLDFFCCLSAVHVLLFASILIGSETYLIDKNILVGYSSSYHPVRNTWYSWSSSGMGGTCPPTPIFTMPRPGIMHCIIWLLFD